jgi:hypothetical protein
MTFTVRNNTSMKPGNTRFDCLVMEAERELEAFLVYNPSRRPNCRIDVLHHARGEYKARCVFVSNQGTSHVATVFSRPILRHA